MASMTLDDEPVIVSEKDFAPSPPSSPLPSTESTNSGAKPESDITGTSVTDDDAVSEGVTNDDIKATKPGLLDTSRLVSDDEDDVDTNGSKSDSISATSNETTKRLQEDKKEQPKDSQISESNDDHLTKGTAPKATGSHEKSQLDRKITSNVIRSQDGSSSDDLPLTEETEETHSNAAAESPPSARQIVSIDSMSDSYVFSFQEDELNGILSKIPPGWKVCVVSVVGAFRTGKSFLLSWFLRYLEDRCVKRRASKSKLADNCDGEERKWFEKVHTLNQHDGSFDWRGGTARNTTGMWMWSDPYFLPRHIEDGSGATEDVAVLLVDTQGMFDHDSTVGLTAAIFGLSTLLSSYQIYNVDKRIQEDNLQQLALFSEYGRMAFEAEEKTKRIGIVNSEDTDDDESVDDASHKQKKKAYCKEPFQRIEFLVRDWQNFDTEDESDLPAMEAEMSSYLDHVLAERTASDLKETREQIFSCFEEISCFMMTHPGFAVIKNKYNGDVSKIDSMFLALLDRYCQRVFDTLGNADNNDSAPRLRPKTVRGRELSAVELATYIKSYAQMFEEIGAHFPKAETMLEATSKANNANAVTVSIAAYSDIMNSAAGPQTNEYRRPNELVELHREASMRALSAFDDMANFGNKKAIMEAREKVVEKIEKDYKVFVSLNDGRNPFLGFETYIVPMLIAVISFVLRWTADLTCSEWSQTCRASSDLLSHVYMVVFFFLVIIALTKAKQISDLFDRIRAAVEVFSNSNRLEESQSKKHE